MKQTDLAYIAGIVDGEGCIRIKRVKAYKHLTGRVTPGYHAVMQVRMVDEGAIAFLAEILGGWYYPEKAHAVNGRPLFCWAVSDAAAEKIIRTLLPFLRIKRPQAETVLALRSLQADGRKYRTRTTGMRSLNNGRGTKQVRNLAFSEEYVAECDRLYELCREQKR